MEEEAETAAVVIEGVEEEIVEADFPVAVDFSVAEGTVAEGTVAERTVAEGPAEDFPFFHDEAVKMVLLGLMGLLPAACYAIGTILFLRFRLNEREHADVMAAIARRNRGS